MCGCVPTTKDTMKTIALSIIAATGAIAVVGAAEKVPRPDQQEAYQQKLFDLIDANDDGIVNEKEFVVFILWDDFRRYDLNNDGSVTREEYDKISSDKAYFNRIDTDGKGHITFEDCLASPAVAKELHSEWNEALKALGLKKGDVIKRTDLPDLTTAN